MNPQDRPMAILKLNTRKRKDAVPQIASWLRRIADYLEAHEREHGEHLLCRLFQPENCNIKQRVGGDELII